MAGLWSVWKVPEPLAGTVGDDDGWLRSCAIVTTRANQLFALIHDRMPVVLPEGAWDRWLDSRPEVTAAAVDALTDLLVPAPDDWFEAYVVSPPGQPGHRPRLGPGATRRRPGAVIGSRR